MLLRKFNTPTRRGYIPKVPNKLAYSIKYTNYLAIFFLDILDT